MPAPVLHIDFESRSAIDLTKVGAHRYAVDPSTEIICTSYRVEDGPVRRGERWGDFCRSLDEDARATLAAGGKILAHNASFERVMWNTLLEHELRLTPQMQDCTMARAMAVGLPGALFMAAKALKSPEGKDMEGYKHMMKMCRPRTVTPLTWHETEGDIHRLEQYCDQDVLTECAIDRKLPPLSPRERRVWELDQEINDRGVQIDVEMVEAAIEVCALVMEQANAEMARLTKGVVTKVTQAAKIVAWIRQQGVPCESISEGHQEELILGSRVWDHPDIEAVVSLRAATAKAFKFKAMLDAVCPDGRVRGSLGYHGTVQGRWIGRGVQFHNMKRVDTDEDAADVALAVTILKEGDSAQAKAEKLALLFDSPLDVLSMTTRSAVIPAPGKVLTGGDFKNIEGRVNAWLAGQVGKLDDFRRYDAGLGPDLYKVTAAKILGKAPEEVSKAERQEQGKVPELACGYQGSVGAFKKMGAKYGVRLPDARVRVIVEGWREANDKIADSWRVLQDAAIQAMDARGCVVEVLGGRVRYAADAKFLYCRLPSGRYIHYPSPALARKSKTIVVDDDEIEINRLTVSYWGQHNGAWREQDLYGGMQCAHVVSGIARDVLVEAMFTAEEAGLPIVLTVHDELLCEGEGDLESLMLRPIPWMEGCPIAASTWTGPRYAH